METEILYTLFSTESQLLQYCSKTTPTGESWFHIRTPRGIECGSLMTGRKQVDHWTSGTVYECSEIAGSPLGSPQQPTMSVGKPEGGPAVSMKPGQKSCVRSSGIITWSAGWPDGLVTVQDEARLRRGHNITSCWGSPM